MKKPTDFEIIIMLASIPVAIVEIFLVIAWALGY